MIRKTKRRRGFVMVWMALCLVAIISIVAIGLDGGRIRQERRQSQATADASALAAAAQLYANGDVAAAHAAALRIAAANGHPNDGQTSIVTVHIPPQSGDFAGKAGYAQVIVERRTFASFSAIFGYQTLSIQARATARGIPAGVPAVRGLWVLRPTENDALLISGNGYTTVAGPVMVNSDDNKAYNVSGNGYIQADSHQVVGKISAPKGAVIGPVQEGIPPFKDPLANLPAPNIKDYPVRSTSKVDIGSGDRTLQPGVYRGGISISTNGTVTLQPGVYFIDGGGFKMSGDGTLIGNGVMIYNAGGGSADQFSISGNGQVTLTPPIGGTYASICFFQDRTVIREFQISSNGTISITGAVYVRNAKAQLAIAAGGTTNVAGAVVCESMQIPSNGNLRFDYGGSGGSSGGGFGLVD